MDWQQALYPLGLIASMFFGLRVFYQWYWAEKKGASIVTKGFWFLSFTGNCLMMIHAFIQMQLPISLVQAGHLWIARRNLILMNQEKKKGRPLLGFLAVITSVFLLYLLQCSLLNRWEFFRIPTFPWGASNQSSASILWQICGLLGIILFASRFWIQWYWAEKAQASSLSTGFWIMSLLGTIFSIAYFCHTRDYVNAVSPICGIIPYFRNLLYLRREPRIS
ncbi:lipid-A-disaccharide synthase N-terminal domain-containing protein [Chlamydiales bacterium]|nr:lipid-A-disaccharide synthase N-terminal domain-containing protein [Chlamydiales bacterium]